MPILKVAYRGDGLCQTCQEGRTTTFANGDVETWCSASPYCTERITRIVVRCTDYIQEGKTNRYEMEKIAWTLRTDKKGAAIGFQPPSEDKR